MAKHWVEKKGQGTVGMWAFHLGHMRAAEKVGYSVVARVFWMAAAKDSMTVAMMVEYWGGMKEKWRVTKSACESVASMAAHSVSCLVVLSG